MTRKIDSLRDVLIDQLKDLYSAEDQLVEALPEMAENAGSFELKDAINSHLKETKGQLARLDKIAQELGEELAGKSCKAMKGLIKEADEIFQENFENDSLRDILLIAAAQRVEHYEIAGYGNAIALAEFLEEDNITDLLKETLEEERSADKTLTDICQRDVLTSYDVEAEEGPTAILS